MRTILKKILQWPTSNSDHQADVKWWDKIEMSDQRNRSCTEIKDCQFSMKKMQWVLMRQETHQFTSTDQSDQQQPPHQHKDFWKKITATNIACIDVTSFQHHIYNKDTEVFLTSLHEIDQVIEKKWDNEWEQENAAEWEQIQQKLSAWYQEYADVFSKRASDEMPPY